MIESTVTSKGQTTLPRLVRNSLGLKPGDRIRYIISDGEVRLLKARSVMELEGILKRAGLKTIIELVWVLGHRYRFGRAEISEALAALLSAIELEIEDVELLSAVLDPYVNSGADFADLMIRGAAAKRGALPLMTFDARAAGLDGVELVAQHK